jgi:hypothetical protein
MVVVEVVAEVFVVEVAAGVEERTVAVSVAVLTVVSVAAVFVVVVVLTLLRLKTKRLETGKQDHRISNMISSSFVYHILTYLLHRDNRRSRW